MAGTQERTVVNAKDIGSWYLNKLIENAPTQPPHATFEGIEHTIPFGAGVEIHPVLKEMLALDNLSWKVLGINPMSALFIGGNFDNEREVDVNHALATIDLARRIDLSDGKEKPIPLFVRIAGVAKNNRIVAATYDLTDGNRLARLNVSLPPRESLSINNDDYLSSRHLDQFWITIPTNKDRPYDTAGLITQSMCDKVGTTIRILQEYANKALALQFKEHATIIGKPETPSDTRVLDYAFNKMGYYIRRGNGFFKIGLDVADAGRKYLEPWEVSIPAYIQKAQ